MSRLRPDVPLSVAPVPRTHAAKPRSRAIRRSVSTTAAEAIGQISPGCEVFVLTDGRFSLIDVLAHVVETIGPCEVYLSTWNAAGDDIQAAHAFVLDGRVKSMRLVVDPSFRARKPEFCRVLTDLFGNDAIRTIPIHAKFATVRAPGWTLAIRSSMNLNPNRRVETVEISDDPSLCSFLTGFVDEVFATNGPAANFTSQSRALIARHDADSVALFDRPGKLLF